MELCSENLNFYVAYVEIEKHIHEEIASKQGTSIESISTALERFLSREKPELRIGSTLNEDLYVPEKQVDRLFEIRDMFLSDDSPNEINLPSKLKKKIMQSLELERNRIPCNVYDEAAGDILRLLYTDVFKRFVSTRGKGPITAKMQSFASREGVSAKDLDSVLRGINANVSGGSIEKKSRF
jgi:hypothetical protein